MYSVPFFIYYLLIEELQGLVEASYKTCPTLKNELKFCNSFLNDSQDSTESYH